MAVWSVHVTDHDGAGVGSMSVVGNMGDALAAAVWKFPAAQRLRIRQMQVVEGVKGTDGCDGNGRDLKRLLPVHVTADDPEVPADREWSADEEEEGEDIPDGIASWLGMKFLPGDRGGREERHAGDPRCRCSRCGRKVKEGQPSVGFQSGRRHYRYHAACLGVEFIL